MSITHLEPQQLWQHFADINAVPRASKDEDRIIQFMLDFGQSLGLDTYKDSVGNVIIKKPATLSMSDRATIIIQSHLDMVHQKNNDTVFDFDAEGIRMIVEGDWIRADGTTLGADNGIGVATIMAILASKDIEHPAIEALFTIDEETGMTGAKGLEKGILSGKILLNLDTEEDDEIGIGCAGGIDVTATSKLQGKFIDPSEYYGAIVSIKGLQGGHSGMDIIKGLGNANKLMNRILIAVDSQIHIQSLVGGSLRNAIPRESTANIIIRKEMYEHVCQSMTKIIGDIKLEYALLEPKLSITIEKYSPGSDAIIHPDDQARILKVIAGAHNGVYRMSPGIDNLVEASNNIAKVEINKDQASILCLTRSSVDSTKAEVVNALRSVFELGGFEVATSGDYPGWTPNLKSPILATLSSIYEQKYGQKPHVAACHAGLECGILAERYPGLDMVSYGPTIRGAHSPDEKVCISSVQKFWDYTMDILKNIPKAS
jgi:dipeptidase D